MLDVVIGRGGRCGVTRGVERRLRVCCILM